MRAAVLRETDPQERRVGLAPSHIPALVEAGWEVRVESGAGTRSGWTDEDYREAGARVEAEREALLENVQCVVKVRPPTLGSDGDSEVHDLPSGAVLVSFLSPGAAPALAEKLAVQGISAIAMERIPRTTRAQRMDALSSQATASGYRAVLLAAAHLPRFFPMLTTAAGTVRPAKVIVLGAGVAGLQAIATARRLGAIVQGYDIRAAAAEQVESLGATFLREDEELAEEAEAEGGYARALAESERDRQLAFLGRHIPGADAVVTTAQIPGKPAPLLVTRSMAEGMATGSVIVDLAGETGGNCELSVPGQTVVHEGVTILAPVDLPSGVAQHSSQMLGTNISALLALLVRDGSLELDLSDDIVDSVLVTHEGAVRIPDSGVDSMGEWLIGIYVFVLAMLVGFELITRVPPTLHTPLMSGANAISGITLIGALLVAGSGGDRLAAFLGGAAVVMATVNVVGGFLVTDRMLRMFRKG